jgi:hypothetical protein
VSGRRGWVARLTGVRSAPATPPPRDPPVLSPGPERSGPPDPARLAGPGPRRGAATPDPEGPALRVVLVSRDTMLAGALRTLIEAPGGVRLLDWHADDLKRAIRHADAVILDMPSDLHEQAFSVLGGRFLGRTIVLLQEGEHEEALPAGPSRIVLYRPLQIGELWAAITGSEATQEPEPEPDPEPDPAPDPEAEVAKPEHGTGAGPKLRAPEWGAGLPVGPSGRLIGLSGRELEPAIGPGQVAPGMDAATLERLRRWGARLRQPAKDQPDAVRPNRRRPGPDLAGWASRTGRALAAWWPRVRVEDLARPAVVVAMAALVGLGAAGWRGAGGPDTLAGEVALAEAAGSTEGGLALRDPGIGPVEPLYAVAVGAWLRATGAEVSIEGAIRAARTPSRLLLGAAVVLSVLLSLLLMRVGPGTGAAAGPGPAPPHGLSRPPMRRRLGVAALVGVLVALDPVLVRGGRVATATGLALALGLAALALAWALPQRPAWRWLPAVGAASGLALLVSPLTLPLLAVPAVSALLEGRRRTARLALAALGLGVALWLVLPVWAAGQDLGAGRIGWLLGRPSERASLGASLAAFPLSWLLVAAGLAAAVWAWRRRAGRAPAGPDARARLLAWVATTGAGALVAMAAGYRVDQALPFALPAGATAVALALAWADPAARGGASRRRTVAVAGVAVAALVAGQALDWRRSYAGPPDDGLGRLVAAVEAQVADCSVVNAGGPDARARLLASGATVTRFSSGPAAHAAGVRYFVVAGGVRRGGPAAPALAAWVRERGSRLADHASPSYSRVQLWRVDADALDPAADYLPVPGGVFSNVAGSACGGYRVVDGQVGAFHAAYSALGGKAVLGRPLASVWTSDGPALQAFDTMVLGAAPGTAGRLPEVRPVELTLLLAKLDREALAKADMPVPSAPRPTTDAQARALLTDQTIAHAYLGAAPASASSTDWKRARDRFGRPVGRPQMMPDGALRQPFERVVLELPAGSGAVRPAALGRLALELGLVPRKALRLEPVPHLPTQPAAARVEPGPLLRLLAGGLLLLAFWTGLGALTARRSRRDSSSAGTEPLAGR